MKATVMIKVTLTALLIFFSFQSSAYAQEGIELQPFKSDYCSKWPDGTKEDPYLWADCCFNHDLYYWFGGTEDERKAADKELKSCVKLSGASIGSFLMYMGVRVGGKPGDADYSWGYGWKKTKEYGPLTEEDKALARNLLEQSEYNEKEWSRLILQDFIDGVLSPR
jgi:hypothetical protein